ncbi:MAG TPA: hypothetical protein VF940_31230 [Streptosporangiaceae bacterium]
MLAAGRDEARIDGAPPLAAQDEAEVFGIGIPGGQRMDPEGGLDQLERRGVLERPMVVDPSGARFETTMAGTRNPSWVSCTALIRPR